MSGLIQICLANKNKRYNSKKDDLKTVIRFTCNTPINRGYKVLHNFWKSGHEVL